MSQSLGANVFKLFSGRVAMQTISFITAPIVARLFLPEHFGIVQIFDSLASFIIIIICLRYELSIPLGKDEKEASASFTLSVLFIIIFTLVVLAVVPTGKEKIAQWFKVPELSIFLWLLPITIFIDGLKRALRYWAAYEGNFGVMAWSDFGGALSGRSIMIVWTLIAGASVTALFVGGLSGACVGLMLLVIFLNRRLLTDIRKANLSFEILWRIAKHHKKFPIFTTWSALLNTLSRQLQPIILGLYFSPIIVGYYSLGNRLVSLPMSVLGSSISQVFYPDAAKEYNETGSLSQVVENMFVRLTQIGVFPSVALSFLGATLFGFVFGEKWIEAGVYTQILSGYVLFQFVSSPLFPVFNILERQGTALVFNIGMVSTRALALLLSVKTGNPRIVLVFYTAVSIASYNFALYWVFRRSGVSLRWGMKTLLKYIGISCLLLMPVGWLAWNSIDIFFVLISLGFATIIYIYSLYRFDQSFRNLAKITASRLKIWD